MEHGWFEPGSISFSFVIFGICSVVVVAVVGILVRSLSKHYAASGSAHH